MRTRTDAARLVLADDCAAAGSLDTVAADAAVATVVAVAAMWVPTAA